MEREGRLRGREGGEGGEVEREERWRGREGGEGGKAEREGENGGKVERGRDDE